MFFAQLAMRHALEAELGLAVFAAELAETGAFIGQCGLRPLGGSRRPSCGAHRTDRGGPSRYALRPTTTRPVTSIRTVSLSTTHRSDGQVAAASLDFA